MTKAREIFLSIGLIVFVMSALVFAIDEIVAAMNSYKTVFEYDIFGELGDWFWICVDIFMVPVPFLLSELSLIINGYILSTKEEQKSRKNLSIVALVLAILVIAVILLVKMGCFEYRINNIILLAVWPIVIASFVLSGIKRK